MSGTTEGGGVRETSRHSGAVRQRCLSERTAAPTHLPLPCICVLPKISCMYKLLPFPPLTLMKEAWQLPKAAMEKQSVVTKYGGGWSEGVLRGMASLQRWGGQYGKADTRQ